MKFAFIADIHLSKYAQDKREETSNLPERLHSIKSALYEVADYCVANNIYVMIIGGDILHGKSVIYAIAQDIMLQFFEDYNHAIKFYVIDGNHDLSGKGEDVVSALRPLSNVHGVEWISHAVEKREYDSAGILFAPYSHNVAEVVKTSNSKILVSHFGLSEGMLNSGMSIIQDISLKDLVGKYELVLLGHYHRPQHIDRTDIQLYYVGSLIQLDWGEKGEEKRFLVVDTDTMQVDSIPITQYRKHIEIEITPETKAAAILEAQQARDAGDHVKIVMKENVDMSDYKGEFNVVDKTEKDITDRGISSSMSMSDIHQRYMEIKEIPEDQREAYLNMGMEIINECEGE